MEIALKVFLVLSSIVILVRVRGHISEAVRDAMRPPHNALIRDLSSEAEGYRD